MTETKQLLLDMRLKQTMIKLCKKLLNQIEDPATTPDDRTQLLNLLCVATKSI